MHQVERVNFVLIPELFNKGIHLQAEKFGSTYSRMDKVKFVEDSLPSVNFTWSILEYLDLFFIS